jgi:hypothetical protein
LVLAIECDGATYHSSQSARDRDRLRQDMLERLGWRFHRIWSSEWFHNRDRALAKIVQAYEDAVVRADEDDGLAPRRVRATGSSNGEIAAKVHVADAPPRLGKVPVEPGYTIDSYSHDELVKVVEWVKSDGLLRTRDELLQAVMTALWFDRRGKKIVSAIIDAIESDD